MKISKRLRSLSVLTIAVLTTLILVSQPSFALIETVFVSGFDGDFSNTVDPNTDWLQGDPNTQTFTFVTDPNDGVTQGTEAVEIVRPRFGIGQILRLVTPDLTDVVADNTHLLVDWTIPSDAGFRFAQAAFAAEDPNTGMFGDYFPFGPGIDLDGTGPRSGTSVWNYGLEGIQDFAANYTGEDWGIFLFVFGNDFNAPTNTLTTTVDNVRFAVPEPTSAALALVLIGGACLTRRRRDTC